MSRQYMDFAPRKGAMKRPVAAVPKPIKKVAPKKLVGLERKTATKPPIAKRPVAEKPEVKEPVLGVIEEIGEIKVEETEVVVEPKAKKPADKIFKMPKPQFINQDKIIKRPLSKNVYRKKVVAPKEEPKGPVTIITKPEKQAHVSLIITIILTIILGAAAGTVAFLLLPK